MRLIAARTSERSVDIQLRTLQYIPEDSELHTRRRENLKSHNINIVQHYDLNPENILSGIVWITLKDFFFGF
jgi:thiamine kinase-like enzyme